MDNLNEIVNKFKINKNDEISIGMKKYLREQFEFLGIKSTERHELQKDFFNNLEKNKSISKVVVLQLWSYEYREFQYLAIDYLIKKKKTLLKEHMELMQILITTKSWWDTVDLIASNLVGELCIKYPELIDEYIVKWAVDDNIWLRRTAIIYQLKYKENTNLKILEYAIIENKNDNDFFIKKAIGWALRSYSKSDKVWVKEFINNNRLSPLSVKEASKYL